MRFAALLAAAGRSTRMGRSKALLPFDDDDVFVTRLARVLLASGADPVVVTVPESPGDEEVTAALANLPVVATRNARPDDGLAGSVLTALDQLPPDANALVVCPVDMPFVTEALVQGLCQLIEEGAKAAVPVVNDTWGHPVAIASELFGELRQRITEGGLRAVLNRHDVATLEWTDARILENLNTPADYTRALRR